MVNMFVLSSVLGYIKIALSVPVADNKQAYEGIKVLKQYALKFCKGRKTELVKDHMHFCS